MAKKRPTISDEDRLLFRESVKGTRPLKQVASVQRPPPPKPLARFRRADNRQVLEDSLSNMVDAAELGTGEELSYHRPGIRTGVLKKLRRGHFHTQAELDLHGLSAKDAYTTVDKFLDETRADGLYCVRIIHGKGRRSGPRGPVLKGQLDHWLRRRHDVLAFCSARPVDGGSGAAYVLLSKKSTG